MSKCQCGCGSDASSDFVPGHDQKLRAELERRVGGILALRSIVDAADAHMRGDTSSEALAQAIRRALWPIKKTV